MHRSIEITVSPASTPGLVHELERMEDVIGLSLHTGASIKPPGDVLTVHVLNRGADEVWRLAQACQKQGPISIASGELVSLVDPESQFAIEKDVDEAVWEEIEANLRHQGRITVNFLLLMALGGAVSAAAFFSGHVNQAIMLVAASVIAPGFEPIAMLPLGIALRRWHVVRRGLASTGAGYLALIIGAALMTAAQRVFGQATPERFVQSPEIQVLAHPTSLDIGISACAALAGVVMMAAYRRHVIAGPLIALKLIPTAALIGTAGAMGEWRYVDQALRRWSIDFVFILLLGLVVLVWKQARVHKRAMMA